KLHSIYENCCADRNPPPEQVFAEQIIERQRQSNLERKRHEDALHGDGESVGVELNTSDEADDLMREIERKLFPKLVDKIKQKKQEEREIQQIHKTFHDHCSSFHICLLLLA
ncbi:hypothetical protein PENTCL1PPCAC_24077, partial [Pristionchus entomophagus]